MSILPDPTPFLDKIFQYLRMDGIKVSNYPLDHICYRVATSREYEQQKALLNSQGELLTESLINGRAIATFKLYQPLRYQEREIFLIEIPAPKIGSSYPTGYEHVEFVIDESLTDFQKRYAALDFDTKGMNKTVNPDLRRKYVDGSVKFHLHDLEYVIKYLD